MGLISCFRSYSRGAENTPVTSKSIDGRFRFNIVYVIPFDFIEHGFVFLLETSKNHRI